ncbi:carbon storage regulator CsrA [Ignatzschineria sp. RMDPL8A]|uniref:carbon storage regulator CsrA n=1 Tax=Ignatzschineria sp. RMDPL8A TaxID=2999236 RepID=UPI0016A9B807|nr:carbon storage regulator CsrA [Ignatzschineria sp. RMDPL8A]MDG9729953.1 carbon storage regulator CsrA [Ignatzschineria sp. RMDPL8A]NLD09266.1 carbon storage regulator CsrA [Xanthomonadaceae bacterium]
MLILTRKVGEKLIIDDNIEVVILEIKGNQIRVGIEAPKEISIFREEVYEKIQAEQVINSTEA